MYVKDIMTKEVITVAEDYTVEKCAGLLKDYNLSGIPVVDTGGKVKGIVTEGDLIRRAAELKGPSYLEILGGIIYFDTPTDLINEFKKSMGKIVGDIMTKEVITVNEDKTIEDAATILVRNKLKRLPVLNKEGNLVGIISRKDIMNHLYDNK